MKHVLKPTVDRAAADIVVAAEGKIAGKWVVDAPLSGERQGFQSDSHDGSRRDALQNFGVSRIVSIGL